VRVNAGKTLFAQVMEFVPWTSFARIVHRYSGNAGVRTLSCAEQFRAMAFAQLTWRESLRDIEASLSANATKLYAMGFRSPVALHRGRCQRTARLAHLVGPRSIADPARTQALRERVARRRVGQHGLRAGLQHHRSVLEPVRLGAVSLDQGRHQAVTLLDLRSAIPAFIHISDGKLHEVNVLDILPVEAGAFYVMDRGYLDFERLYTMHQAGAFFVTRAKAGMDARRVYSGPTDRDSGVICDQRVMLNGFYSAKHYPDHLRRIRFKDSESGKTLVFLTNNTTLPALTIAALYKSRWQVELFFKWIKQHLRIKRFLGTSENAVKTQIWCAVSTYVLIAIVKKQLHLEASLYTCLQILSVSIFEKTEVSSALRPDRSTTEPPDPANQLILFDF